MIVTSTLSSTAAEPQVENVVVSMKIQKSTNTRPEREKKPSTHEGREEKNSIKNRFYLQFSIIFLFFFREFRLFFHPSRSLIKKEHTQHISKQFFYSFSFLILLGIFI